MSNPNSGWLWYSQPSLVDLFSLDYTAFEDVGLTRVDATLSFLDSATGDRIECTDSSKCLVRYNWSYTPLLRYMSPPVMWPGMIATAALNAQSTMQYKQDDVYAAEIRIDGELFDYEGYGSDADSTVGSNTRVSGL